MVCRRHDQAFFFSSRRRHTRYWRDWSSDVCSSDLKVVILLRIFGLGNDNATNLVLIERLADGHFALIFLITLRHEDAIAPCRRLFLYAAEDGREVKMGQL